jgi:MFS family permease
MAPMALVSPLAGVLVDRWDRKRTMVASDLLRAVLVLGLLRAEELWQINLIFVGLSVISSFFMPAQSVTVRTLVPASGLMTANALMSQAFQVTQIATPALAGWLVDSAGPAFCFWFDSATFLFSALMISLLPAAQKSAGGREARTVLAELGSGTRFLFSHRALSFVVVSMTVGMFAVRCFGALLAPFVRDVLHSGASRFGLLNSLIGVGMIAATQVVHRAGRRRRQQLVLGGLAGSGLAILLMAAWPVTGAVAAGLFGLGFGVAFIFVPSQTLLQETTPVEMLGRVSSSLMSALASAQVIALLGSGAAASALGIRNLYFASAGLLLLHAVGGWRWLRSAGPGSAAPGAGPAPETAGGTPRAGAG